MSKKNMIMAVFASVILLGAANASAKPNGCGCKDCPMPMDGAKPCMKMEKMHDKMQDKMDQYLGLSDEQKVKAKEIHQQGRQKVKPLMEEMRTLREKMDSMREENMKEFEAILTPDQKVKFEKMKAERKSKMKGRFHKGKKDFHKEDKK